MDKILVSFYVIKLDEEYDMYLPINEKISSWDLNAVPNLRLGDSGSIRAW